MKKKNLFLLLIIIFYGIIYIATDPRQRYSCDGDCVKFEQLSNYFLKDSNYIYYMQGCGRTAVYDSICIQIKDSTANISWNVFADSVCIMATQLGLPKRHIFIINYFSNTPDTLVRRNCP
jgi:hypothetical protein